MIKVLLVDDHTLVRQGLRYLFNGTKEIQIVGEADTGAEGVRLARELQPTVVILDLKLPDISGLEVTERLLRLRPAPKVLIVTSADYLEFPTRLLAAGAHGYLSKQAGRDELFSAIKTVSKDQIFLNPEIANRLALARIDNHTSNIFSSLSQTEFEMLMLTVRNVPAEVIAQRLHLTAQTIHGYRSRIFGKLGVDNDVELLILALRERLITADEVDA
jgi:two-component system invasion response regulator UvrY